MDQYTQRGVLAYADILGIANPAADVAVNSVTAYRKGEHFHSGSGAARASGPGKRTWGHILTFNI